MLKKVALAVWAYLKDWKNLLAHALVGVALVVVPLALPLPTWGRILAFIGIVLLNTLRMSLSKKGKAAKAAEAS
jgi:hypothetical protein